LRFHIRKTAPYAKARGWEIPSIVQGFRLLPLRTIIAVTRTKGDGQDHEAYRLRIADEVSLLEVDVVLIFSKEPPRSKQEAYKTLRAETTIMEAPRPESFRPDPDLGFEPELVKIGPYSEPFFHTLFVLMHNVT
jgi:hypothetical protein